MKKSFQKWLFIFVLLAFVLTFTGSYLVQTALSQKAAEVLIGLKLKDACAQLDNANKNYKNISFLTRHLALVRADYLASVLKYRPEFIHNQAELNKLNKKLKVFHLRIYDSAGKQLASSPKGLKPDPLPPSILASGSKLRKVVIENYLTTDGTEDIEHNVYIYSAGIPGFILMKYRPQTLNEAYDQKDIKLFAEGFRIGTGGGIIISRQDNILCDGMLKIKEKKLSELGISPLSGDQTYHDLEIDSIPYFGAKRKYGEYNIIGLVPLAELHDRRNQLLMLLTLGYVILFSIIYWAISALVEHKVIKGIERICVSLNKITDGDLHAIVDVHSSPEFIQLSSGINSTVHALRDAIDEAGRRYENELKLAAAIQLSALPRVDSLNPRPCGLNLYATMTAAREVGGDFYDFFWIDSNHLAFVIADVSEKGVPAALFMMSAKSWIKSLAKSHLPPATVFTEANRMLCADNDNGMFVTVFFAVIELDSGKLTCINAGHNPPLLKRAGENYEYLRLEPDFILGTLPDIKYHESELTLAPGDRLFLYTDGVTEAINPDEEEFGNQRLRDSLEQFDSCPPEELTKYIYSQLKDFSENGPQYDDITMLIMDFQRKSLCLPAHIEELPKLQEYIEATCKENSLDDTIENRLQIAAEEVFLNIANYAYENDNGTISMQFRYIPETHVLQSVFIDSGNPYDPQLTEAPDLSENLDERQPGGLGVFLIKELVDSINYQRLENQNILTLIQKTGDKND